MYVAQAQVYSLSLDIRGYDRTGGEYTCEILQRKQYCNSEINTIYYSGCLGFATKLLSIRDSWRPNYKASLSDLEHPATPGTVLLMSPESNYLSAMQLRNVIAGRSGD